MNNNSNTALIIVLGLIIVVGGFLYYQHDKNTATIDLPGNGQIEISE